MPFFTNYANARPALEPSSPEGLLPSADFLPRNTRPPPDLPKDGRRLGTCNAALMQSSWQQGRPPQLPPLPAPDERAWASRVPSNGGLARSLRRCNSRRSFPSPLLATEVDPLVNTLASLSSENCHLRRGRKPIKRCQNEIEKEEFEEE